MTNRDDEWVREGQDDDMARRSTVPAFLLQPDGTDKPTEHCSADELRAAAASKLMEAKELADVSQRLYEMADEKES